MLFIEARDENGVESFRFSGGKWKRRGNMKTEMKICKMEMEMEFFMRKQKQKRNGVFRWNTR